VRVVNVEAVVTDRKGNRVTGLTAGDFRLLVDGVEVPVDYFTEVAEGVALPAPRSAEGMPAPPATAAGPVGRSYLVFIDESVVQQPDRDLVLQELERDLGRLGPGDRMAVVAFDGTQLHRLADWTGEHVVLAKALTEARRRPALGIRFNVERNYQLPETDDEDDMSKALDNTGLDRLSTLPKADENKLTLLENAWLLRVSEAAAAALRGFELPAGRKAMLLLTGGWPLPELALPLVQEANRLGYTLYPVDVPGMEAGAIVDITQTAPAEKLTGILSDDWELGVHATLNQLAVATGGRPALNSTRVDVLEQAEQDTRSYYWLGFSPGWKLDDRHHRIEVEMRRPGMVVRARNGFSDLSQAKLAEMEAESLLLFGPRPGSVLGPLEIEFGEAKRIKRRLLEVPVLVSFQPAALNPPPVEGRETELVLTVGALDRNGVRSDLPQMPLRFTLPVGADGSTRIRSRLTVQLRSIKQRLVFQLRDPVSGGSFVSEVSYLPGK
jgi:VWFA-related protein